jgi:hypothetical protein
MTDRDLESRLREVLVAAQARFRKSRGMGVIVTPPIPNPLIDQVAAGLAPVLRELVVETVAALLPALIEQALEEQQNPGGFDPDEVRIQEFYLGNGDMEVAVTHFATGVRVVQQGASARRKALVALREAVAARLDAPGVHDLDDVIREAR